MLAWTIEDFWLTLAMTLRLSGLTQLIIFLKSEQTLRIYQTAEFPKFSSPLSRRRASATPGFFCSYKFGTCLSVLLL